MTHIPIQNIYYLLCYAWNKLDEAERIAVKTDGCTDLVELFAKVLSNATTKLLKQGIDRNYALVSEEVAGVRGKLELADTLKRNLLLKQRTQCSFDEFTSDTMPNRILLSTLLKLSRTIDLDHGIKVELIHLVKKFPDVTPLEIQLRHFNMVRLNRNNRFYGFILDVCRIVHENLLPGEEPGTWSFKDFTRDEGQMNRLFEAFVRNFYSIERKDLKIRAESITWQFEAADPMHRDHLPGMLTDISLLHPEWKMIIDTKFYRQTLGENRGSEKIHSANLYQLFSYLLQQHSDDERTRFAKGMLLYPLTGKPLDLFYTYQGHEIQIRTIDLNMDWKMIHDRLESLIPN